LNNLDSAEYFLRQAFKAPSDGYGLNGWPYFIAAEYFTARGIKDSAFYYHRLSLGFYHEEKNVKDLAGGYNRIAQLFRNNGSIDSSIYYAHQSLLLSQRNKFLKETMESYVQLSAAYENFNGDSAFYYYKRAIVAKDSLFNQDKQRQLLSYQFNEQLRQKENEN